MTGFQGLAGAKATKCYFKLTLLVLSCIIFTLSLCSGFLTNFHSKLFTNTVLGIPIRSFSYSDRESVPGSSCDARVKCVRTYSPDGTKSKCFPSCIIFGVSKCGTKALLEYLTLHPDVVAPSSEINFFCNKTLHARGVGWYIDQMPASRPHQITIEKSPDYFQCPFCAELIYSVNNNTKLLLLLRDPVERLVSQYMQLSEKNRELPIIENWVINSDTHTINTKLPSIMVSAYSDHISHWLDVFPHNQIHIIESDSLRVNPLEEMKRVEKFLNLKEFFAPEDFYFNSSRGFYCTRRRSTGKTKCLGKSKGREHTAVDTVVLDKLHRFYQPYNDRLNKLLGFRYPWS